jgi:L-ascorbate metabolism protein UlaG (beta-lactamase superfamily)
VLASKQPDGYLRSSTLVEPLQCHWYAWTHTVAPVQHGFNLAAAQLPLLQAFVANPGTHAAATEDPAMVSGPFVHLPPQAVPAVQALIAQTTERCQPQMDLAQAVQKFEKQLRTTALGFGLDAVYPLAPPVLAGLVEASYDLHNRPQLRVLEELVYRSPLGGAHTHQMSLSHADGHHRPFFLNTPRLDSPGRITLPIPFADPRWQRLAMSRLQPVQVAQLADELGVPGAQRELFAGFFSPEPPQRRTPHHGGDGVRVRYLGHASLLLQSSATSVLIDPFFASVRDAGAAQFTFDDLPDFIDHVFVTHAHADHFSIENLLKLRGRVGTFLVPRNNPGNLADPSMRLVLQALGFRNVRVLEPFESVGFADGQLTSLPFLGEHSDLGIHSKQTLHLVLKDRSFLFLADSACADPMLYQRIAQEVGRVDAMFIGMECDGAPLTWLYGPYLANRPSRKMDDSRKLSGCNAQQAWTITEAIRPARTYVYAMGQEPWMGFLMGLAYTAQSVQIVESDKYVARCVAAGLPSERLFGCRELPDPQDLRPGRTLHARPALAGA